MKVVLFCGGFGMRLRDFSEQIPKPMVIIGYRPLLWHVMKYYAHYGHKDFILALGYKADAIKNYFLRYDECTSNDFVLHEGGKRVQLLDSDIQDWRITFVDTGVASPIGQRLRLVKEHLNGEELFLANYTDTLTDIPLPRLVDSLTASGRIASFLAVRPNSSFHLVSFREDGAVESVEHIRHSGIRINGGYFVFRKEIFDYIRDGEDLVNEPFQRLIEHGQLMAYPYDGFWTTMDTFKDKQQLDELYTRSPAPWELWKAVRAADRRGEERSRTSEFALTG